MKQSRCRTALSVSIGLMVVILASSTAQAQRTGGFDIKAEALATGAERNAQSNLWVLEVNYKTLRMIPVTLTNPKTGERQRELVWYFVYKAINRPIERKSVQENVEPVNTFDAPPSPPIFAPEFTLVTNDNGVQHIYNDVILPEAQAAVIRREGLNLKNPVEIVGPVPEVTPYDSQNETALYGVAMWRDINPDTDSFMVVMSGFSNGYKIGTGPTGEPQILRKTLVQRYWRPGDRYEENEFEIRQFSEPQWVYVADEPQELKQLSEPQQEEKAAEGQAPAAPDAIPAS